ncbi:MAG TPA: ABC transporter permease [Methanobacteriaceae archaeon]|nr:ABC transporter permease [Methanobacteriaceae archaeon]
MKFISIASKAAKELLRDRRGLIMILLFPMFFMLVFGFAFGGMGQQDEPHNLAVINYDQGATLPGTGENLNFGNNFTQVLKDIKYQDSNVKIFNVNQTNLNDANQLLKQRKADAAVIIPENFTQSILSSASGSNSTTTVIIRGDTGYINFGVSQGILTGILGQYQDELVAGIKSQLTRTPVQRVSKAIESKVESLPGTESFTNFDFLAPGMIVFAIILLATTVASTLTREVDRGTLSRLKLSKMRSFDFLFGNMIPWSFIAAAQVIILLGVAMLIGFKWQGGLNSIFLAVLVGVIGGIASVSLGMIIASFARNDRQAANLATIITVPMSFLTGAFFQLPHVIVANIMGQPFEIYEILPWTHVLNAMRTVLTFGGGWSDIAYQVGWTIVLTALLFFAGILIFSRTRLQPES